MPSSDKSLEEKPDILITGVEPPDWLPLKFWDAKAGEVRIQELAKSYKLLEKRLSSLRSESVDKSVDDSVEEPVEEPVDKSVDNPVEEALDVSAEVMDEVSQDGSDFDFAAAEARLAEVFGGVDKWQMLRPQLLSWGERNLPTEVFATLSSSVEGIQALHRLMLSGSTEPRLVEGGDLPQALDESRLRRMMEDPRYWRERDPEYVNRVLRGFQQLYGS